MKPEDISLLDLPRILIGEVPPSFLLEAAVRIFVLYIVIVLSMRLMGKRMAGQLSRNEMAALVSLAGAVGIPMQTPDRGLLPMLVSAIVIIAIHRWVNHYALENKRFERLTLDDIDILVKDGCMQMKTIRNTALTRELVVGHLRSHAIDHLGRVKRFYLEPNGAFTLKLQHPPNPGLSLIPDWDAEMRAGQGQSDAIACKRCGTLSEPKHKVDFRCPACKGRKWETACI